VPYHDSAPSERGQLTYPLNIQKIQNNRRILGVYIYMLNENVIDIISDGFVETKAR
jgi:hypothetical protein